MVERKGKGQMVGGRGKRTTILRKKVDNGRKKGGGSNGGREG